MNYDKIYSNLILKRREKPLSKVKVYCEKHHIIPRSLGGDDSAENLINLTAREHLFAHKLLVKIYKQKNGQRSRSYRVMIYALWYMIGARRGIHISSREYEMLKIEIARKNKELHSGSNHWNFGKHWTDDVKKKIGDANRGRKWTIERKEKCKMVGKDNPNYGHGWTPEMKTKASLRLKGRKPSHVAIMKLREYYKTHDNPMKGKNVRSFMTEDAYKSMLERRSESMKKNFVYSAVE